MTRRTKLVLLYAVILLVTPIIVLLGHALTHALSPGALVGGPMLTVASFALMRNEWRSKDRSLLRNKLVAISIITLLLGATATVASASILVVRHLGP